MKNILKTALGLFAMGSLVMVSCTDVESLDIVQPTTEETYPESYAAYVQALNDYKASDHKIVYAWFDNSAKVPQSAGQHITSVPDSVDVISMMYPESLAEFELSDMEEVRAKGTKVYPTSSRHGLTSSLPMAVTSQRQVRSSIRTCRQNWTLCSLAPIRLTE